MRSLDREIPGPSASSSSNSLSEEDRSVVCNQDLACEQGEERDSDDTYRDCGGVVCELWRLVDVWRRVLIASLAGGAWEEGGRGRAHKVGQRRVFPIQGHLERLGAAKASSRWMSVL